MAVVVQNFQALLTPSKKYLTLDDVDQQNGDPEKGWAGVRSAGL